MLKSIISAGIISNITLFSVAQPVKAQPEPKPNILFIAVDDLRPEINSYGAKMIKSPNLDRFASTGVLFTRAFCNIPVCGASRASLLTGKRPTRHRFLNFAAWAEKDAPEAVTLPKYFKENGYTTISNGKVFHNYEDSKDSWTEPIFRPDKIPVDNWRDYQSAENKKLEKETGSGYAFECLDLPDTAYVDGKVAYKTISDLKKLKKENKPFFLAVGLLKPHLPFNPPKKYWDLYKRDEIRLASNPNKPEDAPKASLHNWGELRSYYGIPEKGPLNDSMAITMRHGYYASVSYSDAMLGLILDELDALNLSDNTIVVLWGDNGWNLGEHSLWCKHCNYETSLRIPLIVRVPWIKGGKTTSAITELIDIYPSLCELATLPLPSHLEGKSFVSVLKNPNSIVKDFAVSKYRDGTTLITGRYFYTEYSNPEKQQVYARMLYDHKKDADENFNISEKKENQPLIQDLKKELYKSWGKEFNNK